MDRVRKPTLDFEQLEEDIENPYLAVLDRVIKKQAFGAVSSFKMLRNPRFSTGMPSNKK